MSLEEIRKSLIRDHESFEEKELVKLGEKMNKICSLDGQGNVHFHGSFGDKEKIKFALTARFIARKIEDFFNDKKEDDRIKPFMKNDEIEKMLKSSKPQVRARISDLRKENLIEDTGRDEHRIKPMMIDKILENA